jgi:hypothetical protein
MREKVEEEGTTESEEVQRMRQSGGGQNLKPDDARRME